MPAPQQGCSCLRGPGRGIWGRVWLLLAALCAACAAPTPSPAPTAEPPIHLSVACAPAGRERLERWVERYTGGRPNVVPRVLEMSSARAERSLAQRKVDLALLDRPPAAEYRGLLTGTAVLSAALAIVVHPTNPLRDLAPETVAELLSGRLSTWSQVGGADVPVQVYLLPESCGEMLALENQAMGGRRPAPQAIVCAGSQALLEAVGNDPGGIGPLLYGSLHGEALALAVEGLAPDDPGYPWHVPLYLVHGANPREQALEFLRFVLEHSEDP